MGGKAGRYNEPMAPVPMLKSLCLRNRKLNCGSKLLKTVVNRNMLEHLQEGPM